MDELYEVRNSLYCYANSDILINKLGIKNVEKLSKVENRLVIAKAFELRQKEITKNFDIKHFISIHKFLFEDIYPFAGQFRVENIAKDSFRFADFKYIESELLKLLESLKEEKYLNGLDIKKLSNRLAYYMSELNVLHPFREGNGRATREYIRQLALKNGYNLDLQKIKSKDMLDACIKSVSDTRDLEALILKCLCKI